MFVPLPRCHSLHMLFPLSHRIKQNKMTETAELSWNSVEEQPVPEDHQCTNIFFPL